MDDWLKAVPGALARIPETRMNDGIPLHASGEGEGTGDPHTWLDPVLVRDLWLPRIVAALIAAHPEAKDRLEARALALADSLSVLDGWLTQRPRAGPGAGLRRHPSGLGIPSGAIRAARAGHDSPEPGREPSARSLAGLVDAARAVGVRAVFVEPQLGETGARALAAELDVPVPFSIRSADRGGQARELPGG